jgi:nucleoid DNA-binding protein
MKKVGLIEEVMKAAGIDTKKQAEMAVDAYFSTCSAVASVEASSIINSSHAV